MKNIILVIQTIFLIVLIFLSLFGLWKVYDNYVKGMKSVYWSIEDKPSKEELTQLLDDITVNMPEPDRTSYYSKQVFRSLSKKYTNPTKRTNDTLISNIKNQGIWAETEADYGELHKFCYNQYELQIHSETTSVFGGDTEKYLEVWVSWEKTGVCRGEYIKQLDTGVSHT